MSDPIFLKEKVISSISLKEKIISSLPKVSYTNCGVHRKPVIPENTSLIDSTYSHHINNNTNTNTTHKERKETNKGKNHKYIQYKTKQDE